MTSRIILASSSPQRKKLLKLLGINFKIIPSNAQELKTIQTTVSDLVQHNAELKAIDVAQRVKKGLVIGADTLVFSGQGKLIGKPKDFKTAKENLKLLFAKPCWVYTGIAVIDVLSRKKQLAFEKTKVFMHPLSNQEIDRYHSMVSPLDKAGGFDIEGKGSLFIHRIEGCYFNVIGLPLAKLVRLLKNFGVTVLSLMFLFFVQGCASEYNLATEQQETLLYGTEKEISIGSSIARQIEKEVVINSDIDINERVQHIMDRIVAVCDRKELVYSIKIIDEDKLNAVSLPGGYIYIYKGLLDAVKNDDELAGVIAHEVGHITAKHSMKRLQMMYGYTLLQLASLQSRSPDLIKGVSITLATMLTEYSQADEFQADKLGVKYLNKAGFEIKAMAEVLKKLKVKQDKEPVRQFSYWRTHPFLTQRIASVNQQVSGQLEFRDYLNLTGEQ